ncbi:hypothetical protein [Truepera radiovictrix]|uniref:TIGR02588 family protein n=1 Tax=Truepera radiovictrix (strain DSM 17093 / CIP 108686 / LMG 22925 / RQ-24) TaxID=649638 RepID=D7CTA2_TRURR|nr:hypothetical protein [Truepera radiovictrix]ADI15565.1 conserved hypothetical protein [Truepera radiovictrix DSM 17093]WMT58807.1 hypothetical protein RCV51_07640 [Truepera radiovictrix]
MNARDAGAPTPQLPSRLEWGVAALGLLLVAGVLGFLLYQALLTPDTPPEIALRVLDVQPSSGGYLVRLEAANRGGETAAELVVEGALRRGGEVAETSELTFDFVPPDSVREGGLFFSQDPRGRLELRAKSFREP